MISVKVSVKIAFCSIVTAISVSLLLFGGTAVVFAYTMPVFTGIFMMMLKKTFGLSSAVISFVSTSLLSLLLVPDKECALMYIFFFGYYPIVKALLERIKLRPIELVAKFALFNAAFAAILLLGTFVFGIDAGQTGDFGKYTAIVLFLSGNIMFICYDYCLTKLVSLYIRKYRPRISKLLR